MDVRALVYAPEADTVTALRRVFGVVGLNMELATDVPAALERFRQEHFDCVVLDCECAPLNTVLQLRLDPIGRSMPIFALVGSRQSMRQAYQDGATFTLDKPLAYDRTLRCMRAAYGLVVGERRRYHRHVLDVPVQLKISGADPDNATMTNISSGGMCLRLARSLPELSKAKVSFGIPGFDEPFRATCECVWSREGYAGFRFASIPTRSKEALEQWLLMQSETFESAGRLV